jgi:acetyltransferase-like isoleucine patch superfamily enzyme
VCLVPPPLKKETRNINFKGAGFYLSNIKNGGNNNTIDLSYSWLMKTKINIKGGNNKIKINKSAIENSEIYILGNNNEIIFDGENRLSNSRIALKSMNCVVYIKQKTTFNGISISNVGKDNKIEIGSNCLFGPNVEILGSDTHSIYDSEGNFINPEKPVIIKDHVWVGSHVKILKGATIGSNSVIGLGSIVTKNVPDKSIAAGNPAKIIKENITWAYDFKGLQTMKYVNKQFVLNEEVH